MKKELLKNTVEALKIKNNLTVNEIVDEIFKSNPEVKIMFEKQMEGSSKKSAKIQCQAEISSRYSSSLEFQKLVNRRKNEKNKWVYYLSDLVHESHVEEIRTDLVIEEFNEKKLYPLFMKYLKSVGVRSKRINELKSKNTRGSGGNKWLHPDIVAIKIKDETFDRDSRECLNNFNYNKVEMLSYEIKKVITTSDLREYFFQAVSNSSWANSGYLVATEIKGDFAFEELSILSALHGIGFILLDKENPEKSEIKLQAKYKEDVDWRTIDRILKENPDFRDYIINIKEYFQTHRIREIDWIIED